MVDRRRWMTEYRAALFAVAVVGATAGVGFDYVFTSGQGAFMYWLSTHFWRDAVPRAIIGAVIPSFLFYAWRLLRNYAQVIETQGPTPLSKKETSGLRLAQSSR